MSFNNNTDKSVTSESGRAVAAGHPEAAWAGQTILEAGGNAFDAITAAAFASFVVEPASCGIGGYARLSGWTAQERRLVSVDGYLRAPAAAHENMFEIDDSKPLKYYETPWTCGMKAEVGHLSTGVPGAVPALWEAHGRWGKLAWAEVLTPAIELAERGLPVSWELLLTIARHLPLLQNHPDLYDQLCPAGRLPEIEDQFSSGDILNLDDLARTLRLIAQHGPSGMHTGTVAELIEQAVLNGGGILTAEDLASYRPKVMIEAPLRFHDLDVVTCFCPTSCEFLNLLANLDIGNMDPDGSAYRHAMAECMILAFSDTIRWYGDPEFEDSPVAGLGSAEFARRRAEFISPERAMTRPVRPVHPSELLDDEGSLPERLDVEAWPPRLGGTTQIVASDHHGNMTALCISLSNAFGSMVACPGTGVVLNNGMQNFDPRPGLPNSIKSGKMPIFAAPVIVAARGGRAVFAGAGSGGYRILTGVMHTFVNNVVHGMPLAEAIHAPRVHCQSGKTYVDSRLPESVKQELIRMGHQLWEQRDGPGLNAFGRVCALAGDGATMTAAAYPIWSGGHVASP